MTSRMITSRLTRELGNSRIITTSLIVAALAGAFASGFLTDVVIPLPLMGILVFSILISCVAKFGQIIIIPAAVGVLLIDLNTYAQKLGEKSWLTIARQPEQGLWTSSIGGHAIFSFVVKSSDAVQWTPPILGMLTTIGLLLFVFRDEEHERTRRYLTTLAILVGCLPIFSRGFIEVTPFGFPVAILSLCFFGVFSKTSVSDFRTYVGAVLSIFSGYLHGVYLLVPAYLFFSSLLNPRKNRTRQLSIILAGMTSGLLILFTLHLILELKIVMGDAAGGGDGRILPASVFTMSHIIQTCALISFGSMLSLFNAKPNARLRSRNILGLVIYGSFLFLWNFDLGWRQDLDLIIASSVVLLDSDSPAEKREKGKLFDFVAPIAIGLGSSFVLGEIDWIFI